MQEWVGVGRGRGDARAGTEQVPELNLGSQNKSVKERREEGKSKERNK